MARPTPTSTAHASVDPSRTACRRASPRTAPGRAHRPPGLRSTGLVRGSPALTEKTIERSGAEPADDICHVEPSRPRTSRRTKLDRPPSNGPMIMRESPGQGAKRGGEAEEGSPARTLLAPAEHERQHEPRRGEQARRDRPVAGQAPEVLIGGAKADAQQDCDHERHLAVSTKEPARAVPEATQSLTSLNRPDRGSLPPVARSRSTSSNAAKLEMITARRHRRYARGPGS